MQAHEQLGEILSMLKDAFPDKDAAALPASPEVGRAREVSGNGRQGDGMDPLLSSRSVLGPSLVSCPLALFASRILDSRGAGPPRHESLLSFLRRARLGTNRAVAEAGMSRVGRWL